MAASKLLHMYVHVPTMLECKKCQWFLSECNMSCSLLSIVTSNKWQYLCECWIFLWCLFWNIPIIDIWRYLQCQNANVMYQSCQKWNWCAHCLPQWAARLPLIYHRTRSLWGWESKLGPLWVDGWKTFVSIGSMHRWQVQMAGRQWAGNLWMDGVIDLWGCLDEQELLWIVDMTYFHLWVHTIHAEVATSSCSSEWKQMRCHTRVGSG